MGEEANGVEATAVSETQLNKEIFKHLNFQTIVI